MGEARITLPWKHIAALFARRARNWRANFRSVGADNAANIRERDHLRADNDAMSRRFMAQCAEMDSMRERLERAEGLVDGMHRGRIGVNHFSVRAFLAPVTGEAKPAPRHALVSATVAAIAEAPSFEGARRAEHEFMPTDGDAASCATRPKKRTGL